MDGHQREQPREETVWLVRAHDAKSAKMARQDYEPSDGFVYEISRCIRPHTILSEIFADTFQERRAQVVQVKANLEAGIKPTGQRTIFYDILTNPQVGPEEKTTRHLMNEAQVLVAAGTVSTGHTLSTTTFHVLDNPEILCKLQDELKTVMPNADASPSWTQLERLPYLVSHIPFSNTSCQCIYIECY